MLAKAKCIETSWDYRDANTKEHTHCFHTYPAMMIPQVAGRLIDLYGKEGQTLFDPYCGTGTSLVESSLRGINACGTDLNPMARLIAQAKTTVLDPQALEAHTQAFTRLAASPNRCHEAPETPAPTFKNIDFWFKEGTKRQLATVKRFVDGIQDEKVRRFFLVAFSETVRDCSLTRNGEFKLYRMSDQQLAAFNPNVFGVMAAKIARNRVGLQSYAASMGEPAQVRVYGFDTSQGIHEIAGDSIDLVVTSPPYGDSRTTVAYGQFSRLSNEWLGMGDACQLDRRLMGGEAKHIVKTGIDVLDRSVQAVAQNDEKRAMDVYSFYCDYAQSISNVSKVVRKGGYACYVVGNRRVKDTVLPTDEITQRLFQKCGFKHVKTFTRNIPHKRMPSQNSPTNEVGKKATTMNKEFIVVMRKR